ncbi:hypothetical protein [Pyrobaculum sp.]|uniref:hypothetical protein n=1 Tax=Pyrobaculum sp. TaxID=2004705 RepID=UPI003D0AED80
MCRYFYKWRREHHHEDVAVEVDEDCVIIECIDCDLGELYAAHMQVGMSHLYAEVHTVKICRMSPRHPHPVGVLLGRDEGGRAVPGGWVWQGMYKVEAEGIWIEVRGEFDFIKLQAAEWTLEAVDEIEERCAEGV